MSTGDIALDIILDQIRKDSVSGFRDDGVAAIRNHFPSLSEKEAEEIHDLVAAPMQDQVKDHVSLVVTAPPSFGIRTKATKVVVQEMLENARSSILITGYSFSDYFKDLESCIIDKSQKGVTVKFFINDFENQTGLEELYRYRGRFLRLYNRPRQDDPLSALHAKVISVDSEKTLITSANLSYHGQEGNIEVGVFVESADIGRQMDDFFSQLLSRRMFVEV